MNPKILLFGFTDLKDVMAIHGAVAPAGVELCPVSSADCSKSIGVLAGLDPVPEHFRPYAGLIGGKMMVLCGLDDRIDEILPMLRKTDAGGCMKAVLTASNRTWSAVRLYGELLKERSAIRGRNDT